MRTIRQIIFLVITTLLVSACATQKSRESRSAFNRFYHNETAYYNGYFNANVLYEKSVAQLVTSNQDNYIQILDAYDYIDVPSPEIVAADIDKSIEKLTVVVALHKQSVWTDDSYLLVGKGQFLKHDYESAEETLEYMKEVYSIEAMEARKKNVSRKAKKKARDKEREIKKKEAEKERNARKKKLEEEREAKRDAAADKAKERKKEAARKQKERKKEAKERAKARKKGKKVAKKPSTANVQGSDSTTIGTETEILQPTESTEVNKEEEKSEEATPEVTEPEAPKKENYFLKHRPAYAEGLLWLGLTYVERQLYDDAFRALSQAGAELSASPKVLREVPVAQAHLHLRQGLYEEAVPYLNLAIAKANKKKKKARYQYILAQIYQRQGRLAEAADAFRKVRKLKPGYEMDFNARLNLTLASWMAGQTAPSDARRDLEKMLKDKKNTDFKDRIFFALAEVDLHQLDTTSAIENLTASLGYNPVNKAQRAETQLKLADLYFAREQYIEAKMFYEESLENLLVSDERYDRASRLSRNLTEIARNLQVIQLQDSLLVIAGMTEKERIDLAEEMKSAQIEKAIAAESAKQNEKKGEGLAKSVGLEGPTVRTPQGGTTKSSFFAYDTKTLDRGLKDFKDYWGDRPLTDGWRLSSRAVSLEVDQTENAEEAIETRLTKSELQTLFKDVPFEPEAQEIAEGKIQDAMISLGRLYRERLEYPEKAIEVLNEMLTRFPETKHELDAWYFLYLAHQNLRQKEEAKRYFDLIVNKYPESTYARVLTDPDYLGETQEKENKLNAYYKTTYDLFQEGHYSAVWKRLMDVDNLFGTTNRLQTKFAFLRAMTTGNIEGRDAYVKALQDFVTKFPNTEEEKRAKEILRLLGDKSVGPKAIPGQEETDSEFDLDPEGVHYIVINWGLNDVPIDDAQKAVNAFNNQYFKADRLRLSANIFLNVDVPLMVIRKFDTAEKAMAYYNLSQKYAAEYLGKAGVAFKVYPVTQQNYRVILKNRSLEAYDAFFEANYK